MKHFFTFKNDYFFGLFWISAITLLFFLPVVFGIQSLFEAYPVLYNSHNLVPPQIKTPWVIDGSTYVRSTVPSVMFIVETVKSGHLPLWSPYDGAGEPIMLLAGGLYNPLRFLYFFIFDSLRAFDWAIILRFIIAGFGVFLYLKEIGLRRMSALFGAVTYMFSGYFITFLTYWFLDIEAILPYVLFGLERYFRAPHAKWRYVLLSGVFVGLLTVTGQPQSVIISTMFFGGYYAWRTLCNREYSREKFLHFRNFFFLMCIGGLIALPYFIDLLSLFSQGLTIYDYGPFVAAKHGLEHASPIYLLHLFAAPSSFLEVAIGGHLFDHFQDIVPYLSVSVILLVLLSFFIKEKPKFIYFFYAFFAFAILKIFGFPLVQWIGNLPILENIGWHKMYGPSAFAASVIAAFTYDRLHALSMDRKKFLWAVAAIPAAFLLVYAFFPEAFLKSYTPDLDFLNRRPETVNLVLNALGNFPGFIQKIGGAFLNDGRYFMYLFFAKTVFFAGVALFLIVRSIGKQKHTLPLFLLVFTVFELWVYMPKIRDGFRYFNPYVAPPFVEFLRSEAQKDLFGAISTDYTFPVSLGDMYGIRKFQNTSAIFPKRFWYFVPDTVRKNDHDYFKLKTEDFRDTPQQFFDAANLKYMVTEATSSFSAINKNFTLAYDNDLRIYENKSVLPRAYVVFNAIPAFSMDDARQKFYSPEFSWKNAAIIEGGAKELEGAPSLSYKEAAITSYFPDEITIRTETDREGLLVLTDTYYKTWEAYIDGKKTEIYPANVLFRGVLVPPGTHEVRFVLAARWFWPSVFVSLATIAAAMFLFLKKSTIGKVNSR